MKITIQTLGCKVNQSESSSIEGLLRDNDHEVVKLTDKPDICIINTCTVTAKSDYQSRQLIRRAIKTGAKVIAAGCYAQLKSKDLSEIEGLDLIIGNSGKDDILNYIHALSAKDNGLSPIDVKEPSAQLSFQPYFSSRSRAFLKIQDGCNFSCTYCAVPLARGKSRSLDVKGVLKSVQNLSEIGYREIVLTGIHIGSYGIDMRPKVPLIALVKEITNAYQDIRIRLSSIEPQEFDDEFLDLIREGRVCPHLHIPLQSGSDKILKAMNRGYSTDYFQQVINRIITACPTISIGTDLITGFPGETENDFNTTVKYIEKLPLSYLHVFPYSKRPDTKAFTFEAHVDELERKDRAKKLLKISNNKKNTYILSNLGKELDVIVENKASVNGYFSAISANYLRILVKSHHVEAGQFIKVRVISLTDNGLIAETL